MSTDLERRLARALRAIDSSGRKQVRKLIRELDRAEERLRKAAEAVCHAKIKLAEAKEKIDAEELKRKMVARDTIQQRKQK